MPTKRSIKNELDDLKERGTTDDDGEVSYYEHPETGELYNRFKEKVAEPTGIVIALSWRIAPFVVEREKAEIEGWPVVGPVDVPEDVSQYGDPVEVSEWCVNPWVDNPDDWEVITEA